MPIKIRSPSKCVIIDPKNKTKSFVEVKDFDLSLLDQEMKIWEYRNCYFYSSSDESLDYWVYTSDDITMKFYGTTYITGEVLMYVSTGEKFMVAPGIHHSSFKNITF